MLQLGTDGDPANTPQRLGDCAPIHLSPTRGEDSAPSDRDPWPPDATATTRASMKHALAFDGGGR